MKAALVRSTVFGLVKVIVKVDTLLLMAIVAGEKALVMVGGASTRRVAELLAGPGPPVCVEVTPLAALTYAPAVVAVTARLITQEELVATPPPDSDSEVEPAVAPVIEPPQVLLSPGVAATCNPAGKLSEKDTLVSVLIADVLTTCNDNVAVAPKAMVEGEKLLLTVGVDGT